MPSSLPKRLQPVDDGGLPSPGHPAFSQDSKVPDQPARAPALGWPPSTLRWVLFFPWWCFETPHTIPQVSVSHPVLTPAWHRRALVKSPAWCCSCVS